LSDNYQHPLPSVTLFGFTGDEALGPALRAGEDQVRRDAAALGLPLDRYREVLQRKYRDAMASVGRATNVKYQY
jgi:hypothetical protein